MQAAEMQIKTENSVEAASAILRTLRHAVPVLLALLIALLAAAPVLADETDEAITDTETVSAEPTEDLRDDYTAVAAQLEAVARAEGRDMADKMLSTALHSLTGTSVDTDDAESAVSAAAAPEAAEPKACRRQRLRAGGRQVVCKGHSAVFGRCAVGIFRSFSCRAPHAPPSCAFGPCLSPHA